MANMGSEMGISGSGGFSGIGVPSAADMMGLIGVPQGSGVSTDSAPQITTPNYVIKIGDFTQSTLDGLNDFVTLYETKERFARYTNPHAIGGLFSSGGLATAHVMICIPNESYTADLQTQLFKGAKIDEITIRKLSTIETTNVVTMENVYEKCYIMLYYPDGDRTFFTFRFDKRTQTLSAYGQDGVLKGKTSTVLDLSTGSVPEGEGGGEE